MDNRNDNHSPDPAAGAPRLTMKLILRQIGERFFSLEHGWLKTFRELTIRPGAMIARYVSGDRSDYANPFAYLVGGTAIAILSEKLFGFQTAMVENYQTGQDFSPLQSEFFEKFIDLLLKNMLYLSITIIIPFALFLWLMHRRSGYNTAENFVFATFVIGHLSILNSVIVTASAAVLPKGSLIHSAVGLLVVIVFASYASKGFYKGNVFSLVFKTTIAYLSSYVSLFIGVIIGVFVYLSIVVSVPSTIAEWNLVMATEKNAVHVVSGLIDEGVDIDMTRQRTALHLAAEKGHGEIVDLLIAAGADVNLRESNCRVPMFLALIHENFEIAAKLRDAGTDPTVIPESGESLLMAALWVENNEFARWAIDSGVDLNSIRPEKNNATALMIAAKMGDVEMVRLLLDRGALPTLTNHNGETAYDRAASDEIRELLKAPSAASSP